MDMLNSGEISNFIQKKDFAVNIIETAKVIILVLDSKGFILYFNPFMEELTGYSLEDMKGKEWFSAFLPEKDREDIKKIFLIAIEDMDVRGNVNTIITSKGQELYIEWYSKTLKDKNGRSAGLLNIGYDVTDRKITEEKFLRQSALMNGINRIFREAIVCKDELDIARKFLSVAEELTHSKFAFSGEINKDGRYDCNVISDTGWKNCRIGATEELLLLKNLEIRGLWGEVFKKEKSLLTNDPSRHPASTGVPSGHPPLTSFLGVPLKEKDKTFGMIALANKEGGYSIYDQETVEQLAIIFVEVLKRKRAEMDLEKHREKLEEMVKERTEELEKKSLELNERVKEISCLYNVTRLLSDSSKSPEEILEEVLDLFPPAFREPSLTCARIVFDDFEFKSTDFSDSNIKITGPLMVFGEKKGFIEICCNGKEPFIREEYDLLDTIARETGKMIERRKTEYALWAAETEHRMLLENIPQKIFHKDRDLNYIYCNDNYAADLKIKPEEIVGKNDYDFYPSELAEKYRFDDRKIIKEGKTVEFEEKYVKNGQDFYVNTVKTPIKDKNSQTTGLLGIFWDITEKKEAEENLKTAMAELTRSNYDLEQFAYVASHDLQEPLRKISSFTELLDRKYKDRLDEKAQKYMFYIVDGAKRMQSLINDLLMFSRAGRGDMVFEKVNMKELLDDLLKDLQTLIKKEDARILSENLPVLTGNTLQLRQVMQNLIVNAIKFHSENPPLIKVYSEENEQEWVISVKDNGIGIENQYLERIFGVFQRLHTKEKYEGSGIGLSICRKIVERHGGLMMVDSIYGEGSTFSFTIPKR